MELGNDKPRRRKGRVGPRVLPLNWVRKCSGKIRGRRCWKLSSLGRFTAGLRYDIRQECEDIDVRTRGEVVSRNEWLRNWTKTSQWWGNEDNRSRLEGIIVVRGSGVSPVRMKETVVRRHDRCLCVNIDVGGVEGIETESQSVTLDGQVLVWRLNPESETGKKKKKWKMDVPDSHNLQWRTEHEKQNFWKNPETE